MRIAPVAGLCAESAEADACRTESAAGRSGAGQRERPFALAIKPKDYSHATGYFHPFGRMDRYVLDDQKAIWTSPFHTSKNDAKWWLIFGGATGALIATDKYVSKNAPNPG